MTTVIEANYPITFRQHDAEVLGNHIRHHHSVALVGMKRVGISNFLRFFLNHDQVKHEYIGKESTRQLFVAIDLNNLVERTSLAFWMLTLKRVVDMVESSQLSDELQLKSQNLFNQAIQLSDTFFTLDAVQKLLRAVYESGYYTTLFFIRFDRLQEMITPEFFANILAVKEESIGVSYVFTSYRSLHELAPGVLTRSDLSVFSQEMYLKPATDQDMKVILSTFTRRYDLQLSEALSQQLLKLAGGHVQYLHLALIYLRQHPDIGDSLKSALLEDEETQYLTEELWSSLTTEEQAALQNAHRHDFSNVPHYLTDTGLVNTEKQAVLNPLFDQQLNKLQKQPDLIELSSNELSRKEHLLFTLLQQHLGQIVERDQIIQSVWPDESELGVSDWAIDRLVARLRGKLRDIAPDYKILTVITRGYKLVHE